MAEDAAWGQAHVGKDSDGGWEAVLENEVLRIRYGYMLPGQSRPDEGEGMITEMVLKEYPAENMAAAYGIDGAAHRGLLTKAEVVADNARAKTVRLTWVPIPASAKTFPGPAVSDVTITPGSRVIDIVYRSWCFAHICDIGSPGGMGADVVDSDCGGRYAIHGFGKEAPPLYEDCLYWVEDGCMGCTGTHAHPDGFAVDPGPLSYKGWFIMGVYNEKNGRGYGRVMPFANMLAIKLLWNKGFELFPKGSDVPCRMFLFTGGEGEVMKVGKELVDATAAR